MNGSLAQSSRSQFCGAQFSRCRWLDTESRCSKFLTGSYMQQWNEIAAWTLAVDESEVDELFTCISRLKVDADVNDLKALANNGFAAALNNGDVLLGDCSTNKVVCNMEFTSVHNGCAANAVIDGENCLISGGQDGSIVVIGLDANGTHQVVTERLTSVRSLASVNPHVFVSSHIDGQICSWDLRSNDAKYSDPIFSCNATEFPHAVTAVTIHPAEPNLIAYGTDDGEIGFLDTRGKGTLMNPFTMPFPVNSIWEVAFHPVYPSNFYIACDKGLLAHLSISECGLSTSLTGVNGAGGRMNSWLSPSVRSGSANVNILIDGSMSLNSFDISSLGILACSDNQMITVIDNTHMS